MRILFKMLVMVLILLVAAPTLYAQCYPGIAIDSSFRVEYLLGSLTNHLSDPTNPALQPIKDLGIPEGNRLRLDSTPELLVLSGVVEASPYPMLSARLAGAISIAERGIHTHRVIDPIGGRLVPHTIRLDATPNFGSWEVAGLYHLWNAAGYRFSLTAGYRNEKWTFHGEGEIPPSSRASFSDELSSSIPFIGMQTSMLFPWWKARFEVLGSPFMTRSIESSLGTRFGTNGKANGGGLIEFQMEGSVGISPSLFLGVNACYSYQEVYGTAKVWFPPNQGFTSDFRLYSTESVFRVGFDVNYLF